MAWRKPCRDHPGALPSIVFARQGCLTCPPGNALALQWLASFVFGLGGQTRSDELWGRNIGSLWRCERLHRIIGLELPLALSGCYQLVQCVWSSSTRSQPQQSSVKKWMPDVQVHCFCDITVSAGLLKESALLHLGRVQSHLGLVSS